MWKLLEIEPSLKTGISPHVSLRNMSKLLETHPPPKRTLFNGVCPVVITAYTLHLKTFGKRLQVETLEDTPARMSRLLEAHPPPNAPFSMGSVLSLSQHIHCTSKLSVDACRSKPLRIHPPACQNSWRHTHRPPLKALFPMGRICYASNDLFKRDTMAPLRSEGWNALETNPHIPWLVVSTPLKNISQLGLLFPIYGKKFQTTNQYLPADSCSNSHKHTPI